METDFNNLSGPEMKALREAILFSFSNDEEFELFLSDELDLGSMAASVPPGGYAYRVHGFLRQFQSIGQTDRLVDALMRVRGENALMRRLPDTIRAAGTMRSADTIRAAETPAPEEKPSMPLEKIVQRGSLADIRIWAASLALVSSATCRVEAPSGMPQGTGILVAPDLVLTSYHIIQKQLNGEPGTADIVCRFGYARDTTGLGLDEGEVFSLADDWAVAMSPYDEADISGADISSTSNVDYALLRLASPITDWKPVSVAANIGLPADDSPLIILHHPAGRPQAVGVGKSLGTNKNGSRLRYDVFTQSGSAGSPVLNQNLELVALHHARGGSDAYSRGIPIGLIVASLQTKNIPQFWQ